jgi:hypothetical protein
MLVEHRQHILCDCGWMAINGWARATLLVQHIVASCSKLSIKLPNMGKRQGLSTCIKTMWHGARRSTTSPNSPNSHQTKHNVSGECKSNLSHTLPQRQQQQPHRSQCVQQFFAAHNDTQQVSLLLPSPSPISQPHSPTHTIPAVSSPVPGYNPQ